MASTIFVFCLITLFVVTNSLYFDETYGDNSLFLTKRNVMNWLQENKNMNNNYKPQPEDAINFKPEGNCREISIDLNLENNFMPSVIQHVYCHNINDPHLNHCLYKDLICHQKTEAMFISDKNRNCKGPEEHRRPIGCECKRNFQRKK